jgi:hypothetical protein
MNLSKNAKFTLHSTAVAAGTTDITPASGIDMQGFEECTFLVVFGAITASAVTSIKVQQSADDSSYADLEGTSVTVADTDDDKVFHVTIKNPTDRYLKCIIDRGTANAVLNSIVAVQTGAHKAPTTHDSSTHGGGETHVGPAEGTA